MLQTRPTSASGMLQGSSQNNAHQYGQSSANLQRNSYHGISASSGSNTYRGQKTTNPIAPYAFTSTPALTGYRPQQAPYLQRDQRTTSAPAGSNVHNPHLGNRFSRYPAPASVSTTTSSSSSDMSAPTTNDDASTNVMSAQVWEATRARPQSTIITAPAALPAAGPSTPTKSTPDRYRRPAHRRADTAPAISLTGQPGGSTVNAGHAAPQGEQKPAPQFGDVYRGSSVSPQILTQNYNTGNTLKGSRGSVDDMFVTKHAARDDRNRRSSLHTIEGAHVENNAVNNFVLRPLSSPERTDKYDSLSGRNNQTRPSSAPKRDPSATTTLNNPAPRNVETAGSVRQDQPQPVHVPPRGSSSDAAKRAAVSSPLSKPMTMGNESAVTKDSFASTVTAALQAPAKENATTPQSPAATRLAALNDKGGKKPSRLRRAFSFGSAAELRKASSGNNGNGPAVTADKARLRKEQFQDEQEAEQARIALQQEEGGIGSGIYSGQGRFFSGSTDNLSISSTASSASIMIRKMGKGMKKSTRSLVGLFRPKSVIGVPAADSPVQQASVGEVVMVNVEAERERVNVNPVRNETGGGTSFPKLERNSLDVANAVAARASSSNDNLSLGSDSAARKSIVGGERERAEVLAAVKKGILKRAGTDSASSSPVVQPADNRSQSPNFGLPHIPNVDDSPQSSAPSTPNDDIQGHRRTDSVTLNGEDYFMSALRFTGSSKSVPATPAAKRNISWKSTTNYHDTWASTEYDRRGEVATCNRLTPMLAQQIKEELNTFKMEMEVHENSKIYTHFF